MTWQRHAGDSKWHTGAPDGGSFATLCSGRWPLSSEAAGLVEKHENPPEAELCELCARRRVDIERTEVHILVDNLLALHEQHAAMPSLSDEWVARLAAEVRRLRQDLETRANELHVVERELAEVQAVGKLNRDSAFVHCDEITAALVEAIQIAQAAGRRGLLSTREHERLRELAKVVPQ